MAKKDPPPTLLQKLDLHGRVQKRYEAIHKKLTKYDIQPHHAWYVLLLLTLLPLVLVYPRALVVTGAALAVSAPLWLVPVLALAVWYLWLDYVHLLFFAQEAQTPQLYELVVPKDVTKSPAAMELFFNGLLLTQGTTTEIDRYWKGRVRPWWSVEIAGINGEVKMYFWCWKRFEEHVSAQLYAQFPEVKMVPVDDYASKVEYDPQKHFAWGHRFKLSADEALPIKTYYDYKLHESADKWEVKVDPMVNILEKFALMGEGEQMWLQIIFQKSDRDVAKEAEAAIEKIYEDKTPEYPAMDGSDEMVKGFPMLLPSEREKVEAIQRASKKPAFDVIIRNIYIADKEHMETLRIQSMGKMFQYYDGFNSLAAFEGRGPGTDYPWGKWTGPDNDKVQRDLIRAYQLRSGFHLPYKRPPITLSSEELATIFHFPSREGQIPGLEKEGARTAAPPTNLPT